jgi:hypothetical protein
MKRWVVFAGVLVALVGSVLFAAPGTASGSASGGGIYYESRPDEVALYLSDIAFARDTVTLPVGQETRVLLPPGTFINTLMLTENGARVRNYRVTPQQMDAASPWSSGGGAVFVLSWEALDPDADMREVTLEYLLPGARWTPTYDMQIIDEQSVKLAFFAEIRNAALVLDAATVYLVAGRVDLTEQVDQVSQVTMNQYAVGYDEAVALPAIGVGQVDLQHVYSLGPVTAQPGDIVFANLADASLGARRVLVWNASGAPEVDVIYKVLNDTDVPLAEGVVRNYQDGLFRGSDFIETTPVGSEGSVTVGSLPDVRVRRTASQTYVPAWNDYYENVVVLEITNHSEDDLTLTVLDRWEDGAWQFAYEGDYQPERGQDNLLRWEVSVPAGEQLTLMYTFRTEY